MARQSTWLFAKLLVTSISLCDQAEAHKAHAFSSSVIIHLFMVID
jgi:hypothetical protein